MMRHHEEQSELLGELFPEPAVLLVIQKARADVVLLQYLDVGRAGDLGGIRAPD